MSGGTWRVVTTRGETRTVTVELTIPATEHGGARWLLTWDGGKSTAGIDAADDSDPREALCVWANYRVAEIRGPGELTTAERMQQLHDQFQERLQEARSDAYGRRHLAEVGERIEAIIERYKHNIGPADAEKLEGVAADTSECGP